MTPAVLTPSVQKIVRDLGGDIEISIGYARYPLGWLVWPVTIRSDYWSVMPAFAI